MSVATYFTNISNVSDRQKQFFCDLGEENLPVWSKYHFDVSSSQDSNSSVNSSNSSKSDSLDIKPLKPHNANTDPRYLLQTPKKVLKSCFPADQKRITPRKPLKPTKSANKTDPSFRGVTLQMKTNIKRSQNDLETQLVIRSYFTAKKKRSPSNEKVEKPRRPTGGKARLLPTSLEMRFQQTPVSLNHPENLKENFGDLGCKPLRVVKLKKECASCGTLKTPLWRDAEDGTPLCNACGIRYKKYRVRCLRCWYIPRKEEKASSRCTSCGSFFDKIPLKHRGVFGSS